VNARRGLGLAACWIHWRQRRAYSKPRAAISKDVMGDGWKAALCVQSFRGSMAEVCVIFFI